MTDSVLSVRNLSVEFMTRRGRAQALRNVSLEVPRGSVVGVVGESGSGKTTLISAAMRLLPQNAVVPNGEVLLDGQDLLKMREAELRSLRGRKMSIVFQDPMTALNPVLSIGQQMIDIQYRERIPAAEKRARAAEMLRRVGIPDPAQRLGNYPFEFSGGMRQRVMIATALSCRPKLLIADEPTTALDVTVQAQILRLLLDLRDRTGLAIVLVTHDLGVVAQTCDSVAVMYAGRIVERAAKADLLRRPLHPYTEGLIRSQPEAAEPGRPLPSIEGQPPSLAALPAGCRFHPRCAYVEEACRVADIPLYAVGAGRVSACRRWEVLAR